MKEGPELDLLRAFNVVLCFCCLVEVLVRSVRL